VILHKPVFAIAITSILLGSVSVEAARTWTSHDGKFTIQAEFLESSEGKVRLKKADGKEFVIPLEKLSAGNRQWVESQVSRKQTSKQKPESVSVEAARTWSSHDGKFTIQAEFLESSEGKVRLKKADGKEFVIPLEKLSAGNQRWVESEVSRKQTSKQKPEPVSVESLRTWTSRNGKSTTQAEFLEFSEGKVRLKKADGKEIVIPLEKLSASNRRWVESEVRRRRTSKQEADDDKEPTEQLGLQNVDMKLVPLKLVTGRKRKKPDPVTQYMLAMTNPQKFFVQTGRGKNRYENEFRQVVQNEPEYSMKMPFLAVAKIGHESYAFALDAVGKKPKGYNTLYFDVNRNGDLTDNEPITATDVKNDISAGSSISQFSAICLPIEIDGVKFNHHFFLGAGTGQSPATDRSPSVAYAMAEIRAGAIREGQIQQGKQTVRLVLVDHNSNGRFDDHMSIRKVGSRLKVEQGDLLLVNPKTKGRSRGATLSGARNFVSRTVCIGKHFYKMEVTPTGDQLKLEPAELIMGYVTNHSPAYRATVYSDDYGVLMIGGRNGQKIPLPEGDWKLANYTIAAPGSRTTMITASFGDNAQAMSVSKNKRLALVFGSPFRSVVTASRKDKKISLSLSIIGAGGERCTNFMVNGKRPPGPRFEVRDKDRKVVYQGKFEWG